MLLALLSAVAVPAATAAPDCGEQPNWVIDSSPGGWTQAPALPWAKSLLDLPVSASLALFFTGNNTGPNSDALNAHLARFGHVGVGWELSDSKAGSHEGHLEASEQFVAAKLKALNPRIKVLALRNDQVVSTLWDCARERMLDPDSAHLFLRDSSGMPIRGKWSGTRTQPMLSGAVIQYWLNFSEPAAQSWWADVFVASALAEPNIDGVFFDCACNSITTDALRLQQNAALRPAVKKVLAAASSSNKLLMAYKPNGPTTACDKPQVSKQYCAEPMRYFIELGKNTSNASTMVMLHGFGGYKTAGQEINVSVAAFLIARSASGNSLLRLSSCVGCPYNWPTPGWSPLFELMPGLPIGDGREISPGVFRREYAKVTVSLNCSSFQPSFQMKTDDEVAAAGAGARATHPLGDGQRSLEVVCVDRSNCTAEIQQAFDAPGVHSVTISNAGAAVPSAVAINVEPLFVRLGDRTITFAPGVHLQAMKGAFKGLKDSLLSVVGVRNVTIVAKGATFTMRKMDYLPPAYEKGEWRMALQIRASRGVTVRGGRFVDAGGDGVYIDGGTGPYNPPAGIVLEGLTCDGSWRNGLSVISAINLTVKNSVFTRTNGTDPQCGIDLEPDGGSDALDGIHFTNVTVTENQKCGFAMSLYALVNSSRPVTVSIANMTIDNVPGTPFSWGAQPTRWVGGYGLQLADSYNLTGSFTATDLFISNSFTMGVYAVNWPSGAIPLRFRRLLISDCASATTQPEAAIFGQVSPIVFMPLSCDQSCNATKRCPWQTDPLLPAGGVTFEATTIVDTAQYRRPWLSMLWDGKHAHADTSQFGTPMSLADISGDVLVVRKLTSSECAALNVGSHAKNVTVKVKCAPPPSANVAMKTDDSDDTRSLHLCTGRHAGCSGHGECIGTSACACDEHYSGEKCDIWRAPPSTRGLESTIWVNCTHGRQPNGSAIVQHCDMRNKSVCEAAGAPTVPETCANEDMFLICDYTGCYSKPFCEGFAPPGYTPPHRNPQPYHCFCPNGPKQQQTNSRPVTIPGVPGTLCAPPCDPTSNSPCCTQFQRDHRFQTPLPILAKPQCVLTDVSSALPNSTHGTNATCKGSMCVLTCDPTVHIECENPGSLPSGKFNSSCPCIVDGKCWDKPSSGDPGGNIVTNCQVNQRCFPVPEAGFEPKGICIWQSPIHGDWINQSTGKRYPNHPGPNSLPVNGWSTGSLLCNASSGAPTGNGTTCFTCPGPPPPPPPPTPIRYMCDTVNFNCFPTPRGDSSNLSACTASCAKPAPPPSPPPPLSTSPCVRFIHALPVNHNVDVVITQDQQTQQEEAIPGAISSHTWSNYAFGDHSNWVNTFSAGSGVMTVYENIGGTRGTTPVYSKRIPLTPGPLVVVIKVGSDQDPADPSKYWPPSEADQIETIGTNLPLPLVIAIASTAHPTTSPRCPRGVQTACCTTAQTGARLTLLVLAS